MQLINIIGNMYTDESAMLAAVYARMRRNGHDARMICENSRELYLSENPSEETILGLLLKQEEAIDQLSKTTDFILSDFPTVMFLDPDQYGVEVRTQALSLMSKYNTINICLESSNSDEAENFNSTLPGHLFADYGQPTCRFIDHDSSVLSICDSICKSNMVCEICKTESSQYKVICERIDGENVVLDELFCCLSCLPDVFDDQTYENFNVTSLSYK